MFVCLFLQFVKALTPHQAYLTSKSINLNDALACLPQTNIYNNAFYVFFYCFLFLFFVAIKIQKITFHQIHFRLIVYHLPHPEKEQVKGAKERII